MSMLIPDPAVLAFSAAMATAAGMIGAFAVMRQMTLAADALSHVALPGIGLALLFQIQPVAGALAMLCLGTLLIWALHTRTRIATETITGVVFTVALAIGSFLTTPEELLDALFGGGGTLPQWELAAGLVSCAAVVVFVLMARSALIVSLVSSDIARTSGIAVARLDLAYLMAFALTVALGLRYLGVLLMGALIIIPAAAARRMSRNLGQMLILSVAVSLVATIAGMLLAAYLGTGTGPMIVSVAGGIFFFSLLLPQR